MTNDQRRRREITETRSARCGLCYWALYDGDWCQNKDCTVRGVSVETHRVYLDNWEAKTLIAAKAALAQTDAKMPVRPPTRAEFTIPCDAYFYAAHINGRFPAGEAAIAKDAFYLREYLALLKKVDQAGYEELQLQHGDWKPA